MVHRKLIEKAALAVGIALILATLAILASQRFGGPVSVVTIKGNSMEPALSEGDLVFTLRKSEYEVGDAVAYQSDTLNAIVLHRVVGRAGEGYVFKGDNNGWLDPEEPTEEAFLGELVLRLPAAGKILRPLRSPPAAVLLAAMGGAIIVGFGGARRGSRRIRRETFEKSWLKALPAGKAPLTAAGLVAAAAALGCAALVLTSPLPSRAAPGPRISHSGEFAYTADAGVSAVYADGSADTGESVYLKLVDRLEVDFEYGLEGGSADLSGRAKMTAEVSDGSGWAYAIALAKEEQFEGRNHSLSATLDLDRIKRVVQRFQQLTGTTTTTYTVTIQPVIEVEGTVGGRAVEERFTPTLVFQLDAFRLSLAGGSGDAASDQLTPTQAITVDSAQTGSPPGGDQRSWTVRGLLLAVAAACIVGAGVVVVRQGRAREVDRERRVADRYGVPIVSVAEFSSPFSPTTVDVDSMEDLVRLAEHHGRVILQSKQGGGGFLVQDDTTIYRYGGRLGPPPPPPRAVDFESVRGNVRV